MFFNIFHHSKGMALAAKKRRKLKPGSGGFLSATEAFGALQQSPSCAVTLRCVLDILSVGGPAAESFAEDLLATGFLRLVPSILRLSSKKAVATGIEVLSSLSMSSLAAHRKVVSDKDAICALAEILVRADLDLLTVACHAVVDLVITPFGCEALKDSPVMNHLLHLLCSIGDISKGAQNCLEDEGHPSTSWALGETDFKCCEVRKPCELLLSSKLSNNIQNAYGETKIATSALQETAFCAEFDELVTTASTAISALFRYLEIDISSRELRWNALNVLRRFWHSSLRKDQILLKSTAADDEPRWTCNRGKRRIMAKCVVQLAMEFDSDCRRKTSAQQGLFERTNLNQELFFEKYWEQTPMVLSRELPSCLSSLSKDFTTLAAVVSNFLAGFVGCPQAIGDQLDSRSLLENIESNLGDPMIYGQDIRMVKTVLLEPNTVSPLTPISGRTTEMHYNGNFAASEGQRVRYVYPREILEAVDEGYTVAIKGMELRCSSVADIANCLARQCGQPSVGVNLYITPTNAQGLDLHYDDHCVFICQLVGRKIWNVFPTQKVLPRLYSCRKLNREALNNVASTVFNLDEGDVLYIPRGFPHKAHCEQPEDVSGTFLPGSRDHRTDEPNLSQKRCISSEEHLDDVDHFQNPGSTTPKENPGSSRFGADKCSSIAPGFYSLHLTFGVEVEPPFEWEGLLHIALRLWAEQRWQMQGTFRRSDLYPTKDSFCGYEPFCEGLLHIAINLLGEREVLLRKACMIAAETLRPQHSSSGLRQEVLASPRASSSALICEQGDSVCNFCDPVSLDYFHKSLELVAQKANFKEAFCFAQGISGEYIGSCTGGMDWLRHVPHPSGHSTTSATEPNALVMREIELNQFKKVNVSKVELTFSNMKAEFGKTLLFHQAHEAFRSVHNHYRSMRRKFTDGMLALHENC